MPKPPLRDPFRELFKDLVDTMLAGHKRYRPDLPYPESHSDLHAALVPVFQKYDITPRLIPLDRHEVEVLNAGIPADNPSGDGS